MRFSVTLGAAGAERHPAAIARLARLAEDSGWDGVFLEDYVDYQGTGLPTWDTWVCLSAIAAVTSRVTIGPTVTPVPRRRVWELAAQARSVARLSDDRLILGVGAGDPSDPILAALGGPAELARLLDEGLTELRARWSGPIWVGGDLRRPGVRRRLAKYDGSCAYRERPLLPDDVRDLLTLTPDPAAFDVKVSGNEHLIAEFAAAGATWWGRWIPPGTYAEAEAVITAGPPP